MRKVTLQKITVVVALVVFIAAAVTAYAAEPTPEEWDAFNAAKKLYGQSNGMAAPDPGVDPATLPPPAELKQQAIAAFNSFIETYPASELSPDAKLHIGKCHYELKDHTTAKSEFNKVATDYPSSELVDDAKYMVALSDFMAGDHSAAITGFTGFITEYEGNTNEELSHLVPFAYFMIGECHRMMNNMASAHAKWDELIAKFPNHGMASRAQKRMQ
jgi:outer membrane protein assembly factor BamD (BamD/ComL family)